MENVSQVAKSEEVYNMKNLFAALVKAQSEFKPIKKDKLNPYFKSQYADLESIIEGTREVLFNNGLGIIQLFQHENDKTFLVTTLVHTSGESIAGRLILEVKDATDPQKIASASTYARRYSLMAILGIAAEDDDGNIANTKPATKLPPEVQKIADKLSVDIDKSKMKPMKSKYNTKCAQCLGKIAIGDDMLYDGSTKKVYHVTCPSGVTEPTIEFGE